MHNSIKSLFLASLLALPMGNLFGKDNQSLLPKTEYGKKLREKLIKAGKPYGLSYTLQAIVLVESGEFDNPIKINLQDPSAGVTHIHLKYFLKRHDIADNSYFRNRAAQVLINNDELAIAEAIANLEYWKDRYCGRWGCTADQFERVLRSYNCGYKNSTDKCKRYARNIREKIRILKSLDRK